jgi:hypothetical protein
VNEASAGKTNKQWPNPTCNVLNDLNGVNPHSYSSLTPQASCLFGLTRACCLPMQMQIDSTHSVRIISLFESKAARFRSSRLLSRMLRYLEPLNLERGVLERVETLRLSVTVDVLGSDVSLRR